MSNKTIQDYQEENETLKKINAALMEGKPSGLNVHQARMLLGELEAENKCLKKVLKEIVDYEDCPVSKTIAILKAKKLF